MNQTIYCDFNLDGGDTVTSADCEKCGAGDFEFACITENVDGKKYILRSNLLIDVIHDWNGDCNYVPANDAPIYFAICGKHVLDTSKFDTFGPMLIHCIKTFRK